MSPLMLALSVLASTPCSGDEAQVPTRLEGWAADDAAWLETELSRWVSERDRALCVARAEDEALVLRVGELEASIDFTFHGRTQHRAVSRSSDAGLFRYQVAAAAEELVRSTWEAPPPARVGLFARWALEPLLMGATFNGGGAGVTVFVVPSLGLELSGEAAALSVPALSGGAVVKGARFGGGLAAAWSPLQLGVFRAGPRVSVGAGALSVTVEASGSPSVAAVMPWLQVGGGVTLGVAFRHFFLSALAEATYAVVGAAVLVEGRAELRVRGFGGTFGVQAGWAW